MSSAGFRLYLHTPVRRTADNANPYGDGVSRLDCRGARPQLPCPGLVALLLSSLWRRSSRNTSKSWRRCARDAHNPGSGGARWWLCRTARCLMKASASAKQDTSGACFFPAPRSYCLQAVAKGKAQYAELARAKQRQAELELRLAELEQQRGAVAGDAAQPANGQAANGEAVRELQAQLAKVGPVLAAPPRPGCMAPQ